MSDYTHKNKQVLFNNTVVVETKSAKMAEFISNSLNLQQRFDIGCYEEVIKGLELALGAFSILGYTRQSEIVQELEQILNKAKK